jgi:DNA/RNA endonuclease YhcR with UshA esterase domain
MDDSGAIYLPISDAMPAISQNDRLLSLAGKRVTVTGRLYEKRGTKGIVIESVQPQPSRQ